jgi:hypothetical protein
VFKPYRKGRSEDLASEIIVSHEEGKTNQTWRLNENLAGAKFRKLFIIMPATRVD